MVVPEPCYKQLLAFYVLFLAKGIMSYRGTISSLLYIL